MMSFSLCSRLKVIRHTSAFCAEDTCSTESKMQSRSLIFTAGVFKMPICTRYRDKRGELAVSLNDLISWSNRCGFHGQHRIHIWTHLVTGYMLRSANWSVNILNWFPDCHKRLDKLEPWKLLIVLILRRRKCWIRVKKKKNGGSTCSPCYLLLLTINVCRKWESYYWRELKVKR